MALKTWLWNLGAAGMVAAAGGCASVVDFEDTDGGEEDTESPDPESPDTDRPPNPPDPNDTDYYDTDYYDSYGYDTDYYDYDPECYGDEDCEDGRCIDPGQQWSYCEPLPIPEDCGTQTPLELAWVREGDGAGTTVGLAGADRVVLLDAVADEETLAISVAPIQPDGIPQPLPAMILEGESVVGSAGADVDGDGNEDVLLSLQDDARLRVVIMLATGEGTFVEGESITFEERGGPALARRYEDGTADVLVRLDSGLLYEAIGAGDGSFSTPEPSAWTTESIGSLATGPLDLGPNEDVLVLSLGSDAVIEALVDGGELPVGVPGSDSRSLHVDAFDGWMVTVDDSDTDVTTLQRVRLAALAEAESLLVPNEGIVVLDSTVADINDDGRSDFVQLRDDGLLNVLFSISAGGVCSEVIETAGSFDALHRAGSGSDPGVVLSGPDGVVGIRGTKR